MKDDGRSDVEQQEQQHEEPAALVPTVVEAQERAAIDVAVSTARRYPRTIQAFQRDLETWACASPEIAAECSYVLERENRRTGEVKIITGPSVRFAELLLAAYRNLAVDVRLESDDGKRVTVVAICRDMERNVAQRVPVTRSVSGKYGRYSDDMVTVTTLAAAALAKRNAIVGVVPKALWFPIWRKAQDLVRGDVKSIEERKGLAFKALASVGVPAERVLAYLGKPSAKDMDADDLLVLHVVYREIKEGERDPSTIGSPRKSEETADPAAAASTQATEAVEKGRAKGRSAKAPAKPAEPSPEPEKAQASPPSAAPVEQPKQAAPPAVTEGMV